MKELKSLCVWESQQPLQNDGEGQRRLVTTKKSVVATKKPMKMVAANETVMATKETFINGGEKQTNKRNKK